MFEDDLLDSESFDPIQFINQKFPSEESLDNLDTFLLGLSSQISTIDEELSHAVQSQTSGDQASTEIIEAQLAIDELFLKINDIKSKASQSENMVQEICADIKKLDYAKTHLQSSITVLKRIQMLITAVSQLKYLASEYSYRQAANLLDAVKQLMANFEQYSNIPMIMDIKVQLDTIQYDLKKHVQKAFREIGQLIDTVALTDAEAMVSTLPGQMTSLSDCCLIVDALGYSFRLELLEEFVQLQLVPYEKLFGLEKPHFALDQVDRRWAWFKRLIKSYENKFANIFPSHWKVSLRLAFEFFERTKTHLSQLLTSMESKGKTDVHSLLKALQTALRFEQEMIVKYEINKENKGNKNESKLNSNTGGNQSLLQSSHVLNDSSNNMNINVQKEDQDDEYFTILAHAAISGGISNTFDKFLGSYVLLERSNLEEMLQKLSQDEDIAGIASGGSSSGGNVFGSSMNMFVFIKNSIKRCTALTTGQTFLALTKEFKTCIQQYVTLLKSRCPVAIIPFNIASGSATVNSPNGNTSATYRLTPGQEVGISHLINTGEYCAEVVPQLEQMIKQKIASNLIEKVDFSTEIDAFNDFVAFALKVLISGMLTVCLSVCLCFCTYPSPILTIGIMDRLEPAFKAMMTIPWATLAQVGEESQYCYQISAVLKDCIPKIRDALSSTYFNNFCTKLSTEILVKYLDNISKQKRISEMASQQLLLDLYNLKTILLLLHTLGESYYFLVYCTL